MGARGQLITQDPDLRALLSRVRRIAVLGIKTETQRGQPAIEVPRYLERVGFDVVPVPVYYPEVESILRRPVFRRLVDVPGDIDLVNVFRKSKDLAAHLDDAVHALQLALQAGFQHRAHSGCKGRFLVHA